MDDSRKPKNSLTLQKRAAPVARDNSSNNLKNELALQTLPTPLNRIGRPPSLLPEPPRRLKKIKVPKPEMAQAELEDRLARAVRTRNSDFLDGILSQLINAGELGRETDDFEINFLLSVIEDIEPRNVIEGMLAAQLAILHVSSMGLGRRARHGSLDSENVKLLTKVSKTFASLADTLQRLRNGGTQNLTVGHVSVSQGGQAIVSNNLLSRSSDGADANSPGPPQSSKKEDDPACEDDSASSDQG